MIELRQTELNARFQALVIEWIASPHRGISVDAASILSKLMHFTPYMLATIYYSVGVWNKMLEQKEGSKRSHVKERWIEIFVDRILQFAPRGNVQIEDCRSDLTDVVNSVTPLLTNRHFVHDADKVADQMLSVLRKYDPTIGVAEKCFVQYVVKSELDRLKV